MPFGPYRAAHHAIGRAGALLDEAHPRGGLPTAVRGDMRRLSVVMAVAALDTYMHRLILERAFRHEELPGGLAKLEIPFEQLLAQADETTLAARQPPRKSRPRVAIKRQLRDRLLRETFQRYDDVSKALAMAGSSGKWPQIGQQMNPQLTPQHIRTRLNGIVDRRNQIVHEGDYQRLERPQTPRRNGLSEAEARRDIAFLTDLIDAIHSVLP